MAILGKSFGAAALAATVLATTALPAGAVEPQYRDTNPISWGSSGGNWDRADAIGGFGETSAADIAACEQQWQQYSGDEDMRAPEKCASTPITAEEARKATIVYLVGFPLAILRMILSLPGQFFQHVFKS